MNRKATLTLPKPGTYDPDQGCFSRYESDQGFKCLILSLFPWDAGTHPCTWRWSNDHGKFVYGVGLVSGHSDIEIHTGNVAGNVAKGYQTDSEGCGLPGLAVAKFSSGTQLTPSHKPMTCDQIGVSGSGEALRGLLADMKDDQGNQVQFDLMVING